MRKTLSEIAEIIGGEVVGDDKILITGLSGIKEAKEGDLTFVANSKFYPYLKQTKASALLIPRDLEVPGKSVIRTDNPSSAFTKIVAQLSNDALPTPRGIHEKALIAEDVLLAEDVSIGPYAILEQGCRIGKGTVISAGCYIGKATICGDHCLIYPNVTIRERIKIGHHVIIHSGSVIGSDGFGYEETNGVYEKIPQLGTVVIEDHVEIGANVTIDRARFDKTLIGRGTKIDNLVQIGHNVIIGEDCIIVAQVGISGSTTVEKKSILAGQAGIAGHLTIGAGSVISAQAGVTKSVPPHSRVSGYPARHHTEAKRINAHVQRLPHYVDEIRSLKKKVEELQARLHKNETEDHSKII